MSQPELSPELIKAIERAKRLPVEEVHRKFLKHHTEKTELQLQDWRPQAGPQEEFVHSRVQDAFFGGGRGSGKTVALIMAFEVHEQEYGKTARGIIFRKSHPELEEVMRLARDMLTHKGWVYRAGERMWIGPSGGTLKLRHIENEADASLYQGHSYTFVGVDEIGNYPTLDYIDKLRSTLRGGRAGQLHVFRCTGNPGGPGHMLLKYRYVDPADYGQTFIGEDGVERCYYHSTVQNNPMLLDNDPDYIDRIKASGQEWLVKAWLEGDWNVVAGSYLEGIWDPNRHVIAPFDIPSHWRRFRSLDWGFAAPYSVGWWCIDHDGVIYRYRELYGDGKKPNKGTREEPAEVARKILKMEEAERAQGCRFMHNPADTGIWTNTGQNFLSIGEQFRRENVPWSRAAKGPGSRVNGAQEIVGRLASDRMKIFSTCKYAIKFLPAMVPDPDFPEDVLEGGEDHCVVGSTVLLLNEKGDRLWTQGRWCRFRSVRKIAEDVPTVKVTFSDGFTVQCTPDHLFITTTGIHQASELVGKTLPLSPKPSKTFKAVAIIDAVGMGTSGVLLRKLRHVCYTVTSGFITMGRCLTGTMSTISNTISLRTVSLTSNACWQGSTYNIITKSEPVLSPKSGTPATKVETGTENTTRRTFVARLRLRLTRFVQSVDTRIKLRRTFSIARSTVAGHVRNVHCVSVEEMPNEDVYCLRVPKCATFDLENGVSTFQCWDEIMYAVLSRQSKSSEVVKQHKTKPGSFDWLLQQTPDHLQKPKREFWQLGGTR